ncbi:MAG: coenzyme F420-0:L-glutamate ligase [Candidatus Levybacteria bacterium]|nr:coenzyme F420-0:L-glutamate ligase [Candidatus Levybacteria bacterium]
MKVTPIKTKKIEVGDKLFEILDESLPKLKEKDVVVITSKIVSITQGRVLKNDGTIDKAELVKKEADLFLPEEYVNFGVYLTIKNNIMIASAGIDESNGHGYYILWPENLVNETNKIWEYLRKKHGVKHLGVVVTDSKLAPMRKGVTGVGLSWCGFEPIRNYIGKPDIFGKPLRVETLNIVDCIAAASVLEMGEAYEQTPLGIVNEIGQINFVDRAPSKQELDEMKIDLGEDVFTGILKSVDWQKGGQ